jgi:hypothetical protein
MAYSDFALGVPTPLILGAAPHPGAPFGLPQQCWACNLPSFQPNGHSPALNLFFDVPDAVAYLDFV